MKKRILVVGAGEVGDTLAELLVAQGHRVTLVEKQHERAQAAARRLPAVSVVAGDGSDPLTLERAGVRDADVLVAVTGSDAANLAISSLARFEFGSPRVLARVNSPASAWLFGGALGVDVALNQAELMAHLAAGGMGLDEVLLLLKLPRGPYLLVEETVAVGSGAAGRRVEELELPADCVLVALLRDDTLVVPRGPIRLEAGDQVLAILHRDAVEQLGALFK